MNNVVNGNVCTDTHSTTTQKYGIEEKETSDHNLISDNHVSGNSTDGLATAGTNTVTADTKTTGA